MLLIPSLGGCIHSQWETPPGLAITPVSRADDWWTKRHEQKLQELRQGQVDLLFIGDSITQDYELSSAAPQYDFLGVWRRFYGDRRAVNLGFSGDSTLNVLWRLQNGEIDGINPKAAVVLIGTNDTIQGRTAQQTEAGIDAIIATLHERLPATKVLLLGILPSDGLPQKRANDRAVNAALAKKYNGGGFVRFVDVSHVFLKDGAVDTSLFMDPRATPPGPALHPDAFAQGRMAAAIEPILSRLLDGAAGTAAR
jgi:lysophospholipase L1-like esterase